MGNTDAFGSIVCIIPLNRTTPFGLIRSADRATLFLDEIGELPRAAQAALLRALQKGEVVPVGAPVRGR